MKAKTFMVGVARVAERMLDEWISSAVKGATPVLVIGAGDMADLFMRQTKQQTGWHRRVVGLLDDDPRKQGGRIHGRRVIGSSEELPEVLNLYQIREVFIAMGNPPSRLVSQVRETCRERGVKWHMVTQLEPRED